MEEISLKFRAKLREPKHVSLDLDLQDLGELAKSIDENSVELYTMLEGTDFEHTMYHSPYGELLYQWESEEDLETHLYGEESYVERVLDGAPVSPQIVTERTT